MPLIEDPFRPEEGRRPDISLVNLAFPTPVLDGICRFVPMGVLYLASSLARAGVPSEVLDYQLCDGGDLSSPQSVHRFIRRSRAPVVGIGVMAKGLPLALIAARMLKEEDPSRSVVMGGPGPTGSARGLMEKFPFVDFIVMGEGEHTLGELMRELREGRRFRDVRGLVWRDGESVVANPRRERIADPDTLPWPAYHLVDLPRYQYIYITGSRGCRHACAFCDQPALWQGMETKRPVASIWQEIDALRSGPGRDLVVCFADNEFLHDPARFDEFADEVRRRGGFFPFGMERRIDTVDGEFLAKAAAIGCNAIFFGIESGSDAILREIRKGFTADAIAPGLLLAARHIGTTVASFIFNFPFETLRDFLDTVNVIYRLCRQRTPHSLVFQLHYLSPLPHTAIHRKHPDGLVRRNVTNLMTSQDNRTSYDTIDIPGLNKGLIFPKRIEGPIEEEPAVAAMIAESPELFLPAHIYLSEHLALKERIVELFKILVPRGVTNVLCEWNGVTIYFGRNLITAAGAEDSDDFPATLARLGTEGLASGWRDRLDGWKGRHVLLSIELAGLPEDGAAGEAVEGILREMRTEGLAFTVLTHIPWKLARLRTWMRLVQDFGMPESDRDAADAFRVLDSGLVTRADGAAGKHVSAYPTRAAILDDLYGPG